MFLRDSEAPLTVRYKLIRGFVILLIIGGMVLGLVRCRKAGNSCKSSTSFKTEASLNSESVAEQEVNIQDSVATSDSPSKEELAPSADVEPEGIPVADDTLMAKETPAWERYGFQQKEFVDVGQEYSYRTVCKADPTIEITGTVEYSELIKSEEFAVDETNLPEGYEWISTEVTLRFQGEEASRYGVLWSVCCIDYYEMECPYEVVMTTLRSGWTATGFEGVYRYSVCVPFGYDGIILCTKDCSVNGTYLENMSLYEAGSSEIYGNCYRLKRPI